MTPNLLNEVSGRDLDQMSLLEAGLQMGNISSAALDAFDK